MLLSLLLVSREKEKLVPIFREKEKDEDLPASIWQKSRHWDARKASSFTGIVAIFTVIAPLPPPACHHCPRLRKKIVLRRSFQLEELAETEKEEYLLEDFLRKDFNASHNA